MTMTIKTTGLEDYLEGGEGHVKLLIAGGPGAGKTRFASFAPRPIYGACEDGLLSVADRRVPYGRIQSEDDMNAFLAVLEQECRKAPAQRRFETVVIDTFDAYERTVIHHYLAKKRQREMDGWEDWGYLAAAMNNVISRLMLLPLNIIILVHTKDQKVGKPAVDRTVLRLKGDMRDQLPADFDFVGLLENEFGVVDGQPGEIVRSIRWKPTVLADWLKFRGADMTRTPVEFKDTDFTAIRDAIRDALEALEAGSTEGLEDINASIQQELAKAPEGPAPMPAGPGGPVGNGVAKKAAPAPAKAAAKPAAAPPPTPARPAAPPAAAPKPIPTAVAAPPSMEEAVETVQEVLGGKVVEDKNAHVATPQPPAPTPEPEKAVETPVATPSSEPTPTVEAPAPATDGPAKVPNDGEYATTCGSPRLTNGTVTPPGVGCGKPLTVTLAGGRVVGASDGQNPEIVEIHGLRHKAFLHNACHKVTH